jgi:hypothetical protein
MAKIVDEYSIALGPGEFPAVLITLKLDNGIVEGPYEFPPAFAHKLSDELCIASARAARKVTERATAPTGDADTLTDEGTSDVG